MPSTPILTESRARVGLIRLNRPEALDALNSELRRALAETLLAFDADPGVGAIVITGSGRAFAAGADIKEMAEATSVQMLSSDLISRWDEIQKVRKPVIAAVSGWCLGGGCELATACDMIIASDTAKFRQPEIDIGVIPGAGGT